MLQCEDIYADRECIMFRKGLVHTTLFLSTIYLFGCSNSSGDRESKFRKGLVHTTLFLSTIYLFGCSNSSGDRESNNIVTNLLAVDGRGYFVMSQQGAISYQRSIFYELSEDDCLVDENNAGLIQGNPVSDGLIVDGVLGDVCVDNTESELTISDTGVVSILDNQIMGRIVLAYFVNPHDLSVISEGVYGESEASGSPIIGMPTSGSLGKIIANAQETYALDNTLELSTESPAYFFLKKDADLSYATEGVFFYNNESVFIDDSGNELLAFPADNEGNIQYSSPLPIVVPLIQEPHSTTAIKLSALLDVADLPPVEDQFNPDNSESFNFRVETDIFDSFGRQHNIAFYFVKQSVAHQWEMYHVYDDQQISEADILDFANDGELGDCPNKLTLEPSYTPDMPNVPLPQSAPLHLYVDICEITESDQPYQLIKINTDGYSISTYRELVVDECGLITAAYSDYKDDEITFLIGQIALTDINLEIVAGPCSLYFGSIVGDRVD